MAEQVRTAEAEPFTCAICGKAKRSRLTWRVPGYVGAVCNACYGWRVTRGQR